MAALPRSERLTTVAEHWPMPGATMLGDVHPADRFEVGVVLRRRPDGPALPDIDDLGRQPVRQRHHLTSEEFEARYGASPDDVATVTEFGRDHGLETVGVDLARRTVMLAGIAARCSQAFGVNLRRYSFGEDVFRGHDAPIALPARIADVVVGVVGLDERPMATRVPTPHPGTFDVAQVVDARQRAALAAGRLGTQLAALQQRSNTELRKHPAVAAVGEQVGRSLRAAASRDPVRQLREAMTLGTAVHEASTAASDTARTYTGAAADAVAAAEKRATLAVLDALGVKTPPQVAELYDFPADSDGTGECVAIIELGGGYDRATLEQYFAFLDVPVPDVRDVAVAGGANRPGISEPVDGEVCLDIEVVGGAAPGARLVCYFGQTTGQGFVQTVHAAIHDRVNRPSVISVSWDLSEGFWMATPGMVDLMEDVLVDAALLGITVVCSAGDYGTATTFHDGEAWVDYPASSPHVIACGGTTLASLGTSIVAETVWNTSAGMGQTTGGGISRLFPVPSWQERVALPRSLNAGASPGRGVPDVAANADPRTGYLVQVTGAGTRIICGTSSAAPLWAALIARINQRLGTRVGYINPLLYAAGPTGAFRDVVTGDNTFYYGYTGAFFPGYRATSGWDAVTGWGAPHGSRLSDVLGGP